MQSVTPKTTRSGRILSFPPHSRRSGGAFGKIILYFLLVALSVVYIIPFVWLLSSSLKNNADIFLMPPKWIPDPVEWRNYFEAVTQVPYFRFVMNTLLVTFFVLLANVFVSALVAYAFSRLKARFKNFWFVLLLSTMMLPGQVTMIPLFIMFKSLGWVDTLLPLIVPTFFGGSALYVFLIRQYFSTISLSVDDAAKIDGCSYFGTFFRILLPLSKPILITVGIFSFMGSWNDFMGPLIYLQSTDHFTLALGMNLFKTQYIQNWNYTMAYNVLMVLPPLILFFVAQKYFIQGIVITGSK